MESPAKAWRRAQEAKPRLAAPFNLVLRAESASAGVDLDVVVDAMTMWHHSPLLKDMADCAKGRPPRAAGRIRGAPPRCGARVVSSAAAGLAGRAAAGNLQLCSQVWDAAREGPGDPGD